MKVTEGMLFFSSETQEGCRKQSFAGEAVA